LNNFRENIETHFNDAADKDGAHQELFKLFVNLFTIGNDFYHKMTASKLALQIRFIENSADIEPIKITSENSELSRLREAIDADGSIAELIEKFLHDLFFKLKANSIEYGAEKLKFLFDKLKIKTSIK
jgi:hypothetical protein